MSSNVQQCGPLAPAVTGLGYLLKGRPERGVWSGLSTLGISLELTDSHADLHRVRYTPARRFGS